MAIPAAVHVVAWLALGAGVGVVIARQNALNERLDSQECPRTDPGPTARCPVSPEPLAAGKELVDAKARVEETAKRLEAANNELKTLRADHEKLVAIVMATPEGKAIEEGGGKFVERPGFEDAVRAVVDRYATEQKFRDALKKATGPLVPKKPYFAELAKVLKLTPNQSTRFEEDIKGIQTELFQILQVPRDDGIVPFEEIQQAEQYPEGNPKKAEIFLKLFKNTIPGTQETYIERAMSLVGRVRKSTEAYLDEGQRDILNTIDLDWFGIKMQ